MASKFQQFLEAKKIDPRRILVASRQVERLRPADRALKLKKRQGKASEGDDKTPEKPRSGRAVTPRLLSQAASGEQISGPAKSRLLRAVNRLLEQKKQDPADLKSLF